jgi:RimJ/RimL family protein N-acetyltransferase
LSCQPDVVEKLTQWRRMFMHFFLTQFPATAERTAKWLEKVVVPADDRILFLISDLDGQWVGNFGVCDIRPHSAELDNLIRGEAVSQPQFILYTELAMLSWLYFGLGIDSVTLHVFSNNVKTIKLHFKAGFAEKQRSQLSKLQEGNEIKYLIDSREGEPVDFTYIEMEMQGPEFERRNPWVKAGYADLWR